MVDTGIFATTAEVQRKVGANASATSNTEAYINDFMMQAESFINVATGKNWTDLYSSLNVDKKGILKECASSLAAVYVLNYDATLIKTANGLIEFEDRIIVLVHRVKECLRILSQAGAETFLAAA